LLVQGFILKVDVTQFNLLKLLRSSVAGAVSGEKSPPDRTPATSNLLLDCVVNAVKVNALKSRYNYNK